MPRPQATPSIPLCDRFGFDAAWRKAQLELVGLDDYTSRQVRRLHELVLTPEASQRLVDEFYRQLTRNEQAAALLSSFDQARLTGQQFEYLRHFGVDFGQPEYFETRARVGVAHARVGVPLSLYLAAFGLLQTLILDTIAGLRHDSDELRVLGRLVLRLTTLDIAVATEVYHRSRVQDLDRSVKQLEHERQALRQQLERDELTGVSSRASLLDELDTAMKRAAKTGQPLCLVMADLDHFKRINDSHGHVIGDRVLAEVGARIKAALREFDLVGRYGGEEFVLLFENTSPHTAYQIAERVRQRIGSEPVKVKGHSLDVTISQGLAVMQTGDDARSFLQLADQRMYQAKQAGRNCIAPEKKDVAGR